MNKNHSTKSYNPDNPQIWIPIAIGTDSDKNRHQPNAVSSTRQLKKTWIMEAFRNTCPAKAAKTILHHKNYQYATCSNLSFFFYFYQL